VDEGRVLLSGESAAAVYVSAGHSAAANPGTGKIAGTVETLKDDLSPPLPAGADAPEDSGTSSASGGLDLDIKWSK
jgi:hypothetical protein